MYEKLKKNLTKYDLFNLNNFYYKSKVCKLHGAEFIKIIGFD